MKHSSTFIQAVKEIITQNTHNFQIETNFNHIQAYAREIFTMGLFYMEYIDAIHEGDGLCILRC